jgi:hypothetical protein
MAAAVHRKQSRSSLSLGLLGSSSLNRRMFLISTAAMGLSISCPCLAQVNARSDWSAFAELGDVIRDIGNTDEPLVPQATAIRLRTFAIQITMLLESASASVKQLGKTANKATCSIDEEVDARLNAADPVKASIFKLSALLNDLSGYLKPKTREAALHVAESLEQLAFDRSGWLGAIRRFCSLSPDERKQFLLELEFGADAIDSLRLPALALHNHFER